MKHIWQMGALLLALLLILAACAEKGEDAPSPFSGGEAVQESESAVVEGGVEASGQDRLATEVQPEEELYQEILLTFGGILYEDEAGEPYLSARKGLSLYYGGDWESPAEIEDGGILTWVRTMQLWNEMSEEEEREFFASPFGEDTGWFFPEDYYEELVTGYFDIDPVRLRASDYYYPAHKGYWAQSGGGIGDTPAIELLEARREGEQVCLRLALQPADGQAERKALTVRLLPGGGYRFVSYRTEA